MAAAGLDAAQLRRRIELEERALVAESLAAARAEPEPETSRAFEDVFA
jgi:TPP-dependent pyruvate/acetoin dehydrogenase alpha subunit